MTIAEKLQIISENQQKLYDKGVSDGAKPNPEYIIPKDKIGNPAYIYDISERNHQISIKLNSNTITDFSDIKIKITGKNFCNINDVVVGNSISGAGVSYAIARVPNSKGMVIPCIKVQPDTHYSFSLDNSVYRLYRICEMDNNNKCTVNRSYYANTANDYNHFLIQTSSTTTWLAIGLYNKEADASIDDWQNIRLQMEKNIRATEYEQYWEKIYTSTQNGENIIPSIYSYLSIETQDTVDAPLDRAITKQMNDIILNISYEKSFGMHQEQKRFWHALQLGGTRTNYTSYAFINYYDDIFLPQYDFTPTNATYLFANAQIPHLWEILQTQQIKLDFSKATVISGAFEGSSIMRLPEINCTTVDTQTSGSKYGLNYICARATKLHTIDKLIVHEGIATYSNSFQQAYQLQNINIEGYIGATISFADSSKLTKASIQNILNALSPNITTTKTATFNKTAIDDAFKTTNADGEEILGSQSEEWLAIVAEKNALNWSIIPNGG